MSLNAEFDKAASKAAEEVLRAIYGDDFAGCKVSLEAIAEVIRAAMNPMATKSQSLVDMYDKVVQGIHRISTPPDIREVADAGALRSILGERLDAIHSITTETIETTGRLLNP